MPFLPLLFALGGSFLGAAAGAAIGMATIGASIGWMIGSAIGSALAAPDKQVQQGPRLEDLSVQMATYGVPIKRVFGAARLAGNWIWTPGIQETVQKQTDTVGSFLGIGGTKVVTYTYTYSISAAIAICEGPVDAVRRIWADGRLIYDMRDPTVADQTAWIDEPPADAGTAEIGAGVAINPENLKIRIHLGTETQGVDSTIVAQSFVFVTDQNGSQTRQPVDADLHPAYRGLCYVVFTDFPLEAYGNRIPQFEFEVIKGPPAYPVEWWNIFDSQDANYQYRPGSVNQSIFTKDGRFMVQEFGHSWQFAVYDVATRQMMYTAGSYADVWGSSEYGHIDIDSAGYLYKGWYVDNTRTCTPGNDFIMHKIDFRTGAVVAHTPYAERQADGSCPTPYFSWGAYQIKAIEEIGLVVWTRIVGKGLESADMFTLQPGPKIALPQTGRFIAHDPWGHVFVICSNFSAHIPHTHVSFLDFS